MEAQTTEQQNALKDAMARAKQIAAKLQQQKAEDESKKRTLSDLDSSEPLSKRMSIVGAVDHSDPKVIAQQVANSLVQRAGIGSMMVDEVSVPNKLVGLVIGKGGEMINRLQTDSGAKIQVAPDPPAEMSDFDRQITITGTSDAVNKAKELIEKIKTDGKVPDRLMAQTNQFGEFSVDVNIPADKIGLVIGKGGEMIKSLQEQASCKMVLFQDGDYPNGEKPLRISGEQERVLYGKQLVQDLITSASKTQHTTVPMTDNVGEGGYDEQEVPKEAVGFIIGSRGVNINNIQMTTGCRIQFKDDPNGESTGKKIATMTGTSEAVVLGKEKLLEILQAHTDRTNGNLRGGGRMRGGFRGRGQNMRGGPRGFNNFGGPRPNWGGPPNRGGWGGPRFGGPRQGLGGSNVLQPGHVHMTIDVPANKCGLIIGKGGETLKTIHQETGINIEVNRGGPDNSPVRAFHLRGTNEQVEKAQAYIREKISDQSLVAKPYTGGENQYQGGGQQWGSSPSNQWYGQQQGYNQGWNQGWNQQAQQGWNQYNQYQQPWGQQWPQQQQQAVPAASSTTPTSTTSSDPSQQQQGGQQDYSAAWAAYYQQQNQYMQYMQQQTPSNGAAPATSTPSSTEAPASTDNSQAYADYQAKMAEYYKSFGQQPPAQ